MSDHSGARPRKWPEDLRSRKWYGAQDLLTGASFRNAVTAVLALGGSTNAIIHLIAMARRAGVSLGLGDFETLGRRTPLLANIRPASAYLMEDFFYAGGLRALLANADRWRTCRTATSSSWMCLRDASCCR